MVKKLFVLVLYVALSPVVILFAQQQNTTTIVLQSRRETIKPKEFFIADVNDNRTNKAVLGKLQPYGTTTKTAYVTNIEGGSKALTAFIRSSVVEDRSLRPVIININELLVNEEPAVKGAVNGSVKITLSFELQGTYSAISLTSYSTITTYQRPAGPAQSLEPIVNRAITNGISFFDNWINREADSNIKLGRRVELSFSDYDSNNEGDTIYYKPNRPLSWADFKGRAPNASKHGAEVFSYIGYDQVIDLKDGVIKVDIAVKTWLAKSACWVLPGMRNDYALNHEQRHFDLTLVVAEHFKARLKALTLAPDTYEGELNMAYLDGLRELNTLQKQYDDETAHGENTNTQRQWDIRIDKELAESGIKR